MTGQHGRRLEMCHRGRFVESGAAELGPFRVVGIVCSQGLVLRVRGVRLRMDTSTSPDVGNALVASCHSASRCHVMPRRAQSRRCQMAGHRHRCTRAQSAQFFFAPCVQYVHPVYSEHGLCATAATSEGSYGRNSSLSESIRQLTTGHSMRKTCEN